MQQEKNMNEKDFEVQNIFGKGGANTAYAKYFTGNSFLNPVKIGGGDKTGNRIWTKKLIFS